MKEKVKHCLTCKMELLPYEKKYEYFDEKKGRANIFVKVLHPRLYCDDVCRNFKGKKII